MSNKTYKIAADTVNGLYIADDSAEVTMDLSEEQTMIFLREDFDGVEVFEASPAFAVILHETYKIKGFEY